MNSFEKEEEEVEPKESVAFDVNMSEVIVGKDDEHYAKIPTRLYEVLEDPGQVVEAFSVYVERRLDLPVTG